MKGIRIKQRVVTVLALGIFLGAVAIPAGAQNFANFVPADSGDEILTEDEVNAILEKEGITAKSQDQELSATDMKQMEDVLPKDENKNDFSDYTLGVNDQIEITVQRHPEVSGEYMVNNEGKIQYEFVGDVKLSGLTKKQAVKVIEDKLSKYIISPEVSLKITGYNSKVVYVIGEVGRPGKIFMRGDTITIREALIQAGLPLLSAKAQKSKLITPEASGKPKQIPVNVDRLLYEGDLRENLVMKPGDTLYIPPTFMAKAMRVIQPIAAPISTAAGAGRTVATGGF